ncbi:hypothetical protein M413DRAFT_444844 [Hebeloma cylindrosporum]|uniref:RNase III domain-containing protein n=1 Tax=Hebeloma cylindrosporum TaxID=76867 RepID=A0A0C3C0K7_HEBCY|nr:hypothetical protein M413DRAFT_444844 [Hebeloma cylindrosporum h7]
MSRSARCLGTSLRRIVSVHSASSVSSTRALLPGAREYGQTALKSRDERESPRGNAGTKPFRSRESRPPGQHNRAPRERARSHERHEGKDVEDTSDIARKEAQFQEYLNRLLSPLQFPPELAQRVLTHGSHYLARRGHNAGLSFLGRRVMSAYLLLFLQSSPNLSKMDDTEEIASNTLHTNLIGEHVGHTWGVGRAMVWQPSIRADSRSGDSPESLRSAGLYKVQGETVQAIMGAVYQQHGATAAHKIFHTRLLPLVLVKGGLPQAFHKEVQSISKRMGDSKDSVLEKQKTSKVERLTN